ncbi:UDP-glucose 4-epimerase [Brevundimonas intermedia]|uniref:UDP-glucose 4-epimerase n=1 Tax=Brevundimonas intermedia TaxID=74315 RepID=A0ABQ5T948_9CAUL|nr:NAD-dependent epimerase/dehydratase family protein [Brevundimonas intermedia]GLK49330.1 UDP-glucose 4-epimerase [Brevundimonas intermedia]
MTFSLITGGAGFIGTNLARVLLERGFKVLVIDDLSLGRRDALPDVPDDGRLLFRQVDCADAEALGRAVMDAGIVVSEVWHLAANSDIPAGVEDPSVDLHRTFLTTFGVLKFMREFRVPSLRFASSSAIYGDHAGASLTETTGPWEPVSNYGAMKLASEAQIRAAVESWLQRADIFRFPNVVGIPATHGVILDFVRKLNRTPGVLDVLGDGAQCKPYIHVKDLVNAMLHITGQSGKYVVFNIGPADQGASVRLIAEAVRDHVSPDAEIRYGLGSKGWVGDVARVNYDISRLAATGWSSSRTSIEAVQQAVLDIAVQEARR